MQANIFKIDRMNTHNGPGFRTVVYFKGCPLHCTWCHNPEGISPQKEVWWDKAKCIGCALCVEMCPVQALDLSDQGIAIDRTKCIGCQLCAMVCPSKAIEKIGEEYSVDDLMKIILQDKYLFESSGGGITVTGGEPGMQADFVAALFNACKREGINTAFDTSGMIPGSAWSKIIPHTDLVFLDIKLTDDQASKKYTGLPIEKLQKGIAWLNRFVTENGFPEIEIRTPLVPGITDSEENLNTIGQFIMQHIPLARQWELCLFNDLCEDKYIRMGKAWTFSGIKHSQANYQSFRKLQPDFTAINILISGFIEK